MGLREGFLGKRLLSHAGIEEGLEELHGTFSHGLGVGESILEIHVRIDFCCFPFSWYGRVERVRSKVVIL